MLAEMYMKGSYRLHHNSWLLFTVPNVEYCGVNNWIMSLDSFFSVYSQSMRASFLIKFA